jgi:hypothetical protein
VSNGKQKCDNESSDDKDVEETRRYFKAPTEIA